MTQRRTTLPDARFQPLPPAPGAAPYRRALEDVVGHLGDGPLRFHCVGDTGGHRDPEPQRRVVDAMVAELAEPTPARFFYHLGDVVYPHGEAQHYRAQFDEAYAAYGAPIFAVPGNHDAESEVLPGELALAPFRARFCSPTTLPPGAGTAVRPPVLQPHVHWTLVHDWIRIIGLWANVPEGGQFAPPQLDWLIGELSDAPSGSTVILALHQPVFSVDVTHGSNLALLDVLDDCAARAGRWPDAVFSGHAHVYQRFTRAHDGRRIPFIVAGAGGYPELHRLARGIGALPHRFPEVPGVTLDAYEDRAHGFMTLTAAPGGAEVRYTAVGPTRPPAVIDRFAVTPPAG